MIELSDITLRRGEGFRLSVPAMRFKPGKYYMIIGPSGSGKSTLLEAIMGKRKTDRGNVLRHIGSEKYDVGCPKAQKGILLLSQRNDLWPHMDVLSHLRFVLNRGNPYKRHAKEEYFLEKFGLRHRAKNRPEDLSWGERRRLSLARAVAFEPEYLMLDEPFASIDMVQARELNELLFSIVDKKKSCIVQVTHYPFLPGNFENILLVENGKAVTVSTVEELKNLSEWSKKWTELFVK